MIRLLPIALLCCLGVSAWADSRQHRKVIGTHVHEGIEIEFALEPVGHDAALTLAVDDTVRFLFSIRDTTTGQAIPGLFPAAWVQNRPENLEQPQEAKEMVEAFIGGGLFSQPDLDLNVYHVLTLNDNNTISVVDPLFGFGGSKLLSMISLPGSGRDWAKMNRASKLFVSLPEGNQIALIDTASWQVASLMPQINHPTRLFLQPDEHFLWASIPGGLAVLKTAPFSFQYLIPTGEGEHEVVFSSDNRFAFIANTGENSVAVVDLATFKVSKTIATDTPPTHLDYDPLSRALYVTHQESGTISCIDAEEHTLYKTITSEPGLGQIRFAPNGRWGFLVNPRTNRLSLLDSSLDRIVQSGLVEEAPAQISFTDNFAYIRHLKSPTLLLVPLDGSKLGKEGTPLPTVEVPGGDSAHGTLDQAGPANTIVQAPGANAVLIANPEDQAIYFYKEGMAAPMGQFNNYGRKPRSVLVVDRSLREKSKPGVYETVGKLTQAGLNDVVFFTDSPRIIHRFEISVGESTKENAQKHLIQAAPLKPTDKPKHLAGKEIELSFKLTSANNKLPSQVEALTIMSAGSWRTKETLTVQPDGTVTAHVTTPVQGVYQIMLEPLSPDHNIHHLQNYYFKVHPNQ